MLLRPITERQVSGTGSFETTGACLVAGALISADGTNAATVTIRENNSSGKILYEVSTKISGNFILPYPVFTNYKHLYYSITGTGASAMLFEAVV